MPFFLEKCFWFIVCVLGCVFTWKLAHSVTLQKAWELMMDTFIDVFTLFGLF